MAATLYPYSSSTIVFIVKIMDNLGVILLIRHYALDSGGSGNPCDTSNFLSENWSMWRPRVFKLTAYLKGQGPPPYIENLAMLMTLVALLLALYYDHDFLSPFWLNHTHVCPGMQYVCRFGTNTFLFLMTFWTFKWFRFRHFSETRVDDDVAETGRSLANVQEAGRKRRRRKRQLDYP